MISSPAGRKQSTYNMGGKPKCRQVKGQKYFKGKEETFVYCISRLKGEDFQQGILKTERKR